MINYAGYKGEKSLNYYKQFSIRFSNMSVSTVKSINC